MGIEEDCIRKFTTPSYRAPEVFVYSFLFFVDEVFKLPILEGESFDAPVVLICQMWDLYQKELISEKVDIWVRFLLRELL